MEAGNKVLLQAERDRCWADMRGSIKRLRDLVSLQSGPEPFDLILLFQSLTLVLTDIALYEEYFLDVADDTIKIMKDRSPAGLLQRMITEKKYTEIITDGQVASEKRLEAIESLRKSFWGYMVLQKEELAKAMITFKEAGDNIHFTLLMQCASLIILELDLKEEELKILGLDDFPEE